MHERATAATITSTAGLVTCWAVVAEAAHLLRQVHGGTQALLRFCADPALVTVLDIRCDELPRIASWMSKFADQRPDFADACLMFLADREPIDFILTFDTDFQVYRTLSGKSLRVSPKL